MFLREKMKMLEKKSIIFEERIKNTRIRNLWCLRRESKITEDTTKIFEENIEISP